MVGPGLIQVLSGRIETDTPIGRIYGVHPIDPSRDMHVEIGPATRIAFSEDTPAIAGADVVESLGAIYTYIRDGVLPVLAPYL